MKYKELDSALFGLSQMKNDCLSVSSLMSVIKLTKKLKEHLQDKDDGIKKIVEDYNLPTVDVPGRGKVLSMPNDHPKLAEVTKKIDELDNLVVDIYPIQFLTEEELHGSTKGMNFELLCFMSEILLGKEIVKSVVK